MSALFQMRKIRSSLHPGRLSCACRTLCATSGTPAESPRLTHIGSDGSPAMVDVGGKAETRRTATAQAIVQVGPIVHDLLRRNISPASKGDVFSVAQLAGIMAAKRTAELIPLCHSVPLAHVAVDLKLDHDSEAVCVSATAATGAAQTGVEMEALTAASVAALTVYDMCKAASKEMVITEVRLLSKTGGKSGTFKASTCL